jgi:hypothetical protein
MGAGEPSIPWIQDFFEAWDAAQYWAVEKTFLR